MKELWSIGPAVTEANPVLLLSGNIIGITYSVLISYCFALHPYEKRELIKPGWVIAIKLHKRLGQNTFQ